MICFPNCKINLGLYITHRRDDGYHDLETVFYPLPLKDALEIVPAGQAELYTSGTEINGAAATNLVWKAYQLLKTQFPDKVMSIAMYLHKAIPMGAGLGGGSSDGAFMLRLLNDFYHLGLDAEQLAAYALQLGSDCPFFIYNIPKFATGRGEQMADIPLSLSAYSLQLICPDVHVSTAAAFRSIAPKPASYDLRMLPSLPVEQWKDNISNDFEAPVFKQHPVLAGIKQQLYEQGALYASMSGSGSAMYGIFRKGERGLITADVTCSEYYFERLQV